MMLIQGRVVARRALKRVSEPNSKEYEFSIVTYNILADHWIQQSSGKEDSYNYCPKEYMIRTNGRASHRHVLLMAEVQKAVSIFNIS